MNRTYIGLVHKDAGSDYGVSFPDLPGCVTAGATLDEARVMAADALLRPAGRARANTRVACLHGPPPYAIIRTEHSVHGGTDMMTRLEVRLDDARRSRLEEMAQTKGAPVSEVVRSLIDDAYEEVSRQRRWRAFERLVNLDGEVMPDPAVLKRQLDDKYGLRGAFDAYGGSAESGVGM